MRENETDKESIGIWTTLCMNAFLEKNRIYHTELRKEQEIYEQSHM